MTVPDEVYEAAAWAIHGRECPEAGMCTATSISLGRYAELAKAAVDAVWDLGVTEGRRQAGAEIEKLLRWCALNAGVQMRRYEPDSLDRVALNAERRAFERAARIATGDQP